MIVLPSPTALENEESEYFDDYYIDFSLSSIEGKVYSEKREELIKGMQNDNKKGSIATVHFKVK